MHDIASIGATSQVEQRIESTTRKKYLFIGSLCFNKVVSLLHKMVDLYIYHFTFLSDNV